MLFILILLFMYMVILVYKYRVQDLLLSLQAERLRADNDLFVLLPAALVT